MGLTLGEQDGYPVGVDNSHPHFHEDGIDRCPDCDTPIGDDVFCEACGAALDVEEARAEARWENADYLYDLHRDQERER